MLRIEFSAYVTHPKAIPAQAFARSHFAGQRGVGALSTVDDSVGAQFAGAILQHGRGQSNRTSTETGRK